MSYKYDSRNPSILILPSGDGGTAVVQKSAILGYATTTRIVPRRVEKVGRVFLFWKKKYETIEEVAKPFVVFYMRNGNSVYADITADEAAEIYKDAVSYQNRIRRESASAPSDSLKVISEKLERCMDMAHKDATVAGEKAFKANMTATGAELTAKNAYEKSEKTARMVEDVNEKIRAVEMRADGLADRIGVELEKAKMEFDSYWKSAIRPWFKNRMKADSELRKDVSRINDKLLDVWGRLNAQRDRIADIASVEAELSYIKSMVYAIEIHATPPVDADDHHSDETRKDGYVQPCLFDELDDGKGAEDESAPRKDVEILPFDDSVEEHSSEGLVVPEGRVYRKPSDDFSVAGVDPDCPSPFPLLMVTHSEALDRIGKLERKPNTADGTISYNMFLWAIGYVSTDDDNAISWMRNKRQVYSKFMSKFITESCGCEIRKFVKRIAFSDACKVVTKLDDLGCFGHGLETSVRLHMNEPRGSRSAK